MSENKLTCFVIMPFSQTTSEHTEEYWSKHYYSFLKPIIEENSKVIAHRSEPLRGDIVKQIITDLVVSPIVVADITDKNANVFWELGIRQSFKHGTITIAEYGTNLPFDIGGKGTLFYYPDDYINMAVFKTKFKKAIEDCLLNPDNPDSQVLESITGRGTFFESFRREETNRRLDAVLYECDMNLKYNELIINTAKENLKIKFIPLRKCYTYIYLSSKAIEFLVISRYIKIPNDVYEVLAQQINIIDALNANLTTWGIIINGNDDRTNQQLIETNELIAKGMKMLKSQIIVYRNNNNNVV